MNQTTTPTPVSELSEELEDAIQRAALATKRRGDSQLDGPDRFSCDVESYAEDIRDEIEKALRSVEITEAQVVKWLRAMVDSCGLPDMQAIISYRPNLCGMDYFRFILECKDVRTASGGTWAEALAECHRQIKTPAKLAQEKREQAAKLLSEAAALVSTNHHPLSQVECRP